MKRLILNFFAVCTVMVTAAGCAKDPLRTHKVLTDFFDGVPDLPPLQQLCEDNMADIFNTYYEERLAEASAGSIEEEKVVAFGSSHPPYAEKNCQGCHDFKKKNMLIVPKEELCETCHVGFVKGKYIHGPVSVRDCVACHLPHSSKHKSLLQESVSEICLKCHQEERLASKMHKLVMKNNMECVNCHDAHGGNTPYFLK
ncbi:MAG: cytochrome C [Deltaproteobacteria bacterium]|nr:cytochrome C [Deltaproteobacteria bacterium]